MTSPLPTKRSGLMAQRTRWEHGHMKTLLTQTPQLMLRFLTTGWISLLALALELSVPPLSLLISVSLGSSLILGGVGHATGNWTAFACLTSALATAMAGIALVWTRSGQHILPGKMVVAEIPRYLSVKAPMYLRFLSRPQSEWVRTERSHPVASQSDDLPHPHAAGLTSNEPANSDT